ncbi:GNAT family N-acetyltransferase [Massilia sp. BSC265]|uniref:GNAT family N-acetyltransferase n=1 Tax=Massilia sp. BSC265 TaxID=1549812 RepID=UPI000690C406|nr:GNAT family N-acetyltransferase [Massilia sp. BSC265]
MASEVLADLYFMLPTTLPRLQGDTVELRSMTSGDASALFQIYSDPAVMEYTDEEPFNNPGTVSLMLQSVHTLLVKGESLEWAIVPIGSDTPIGTCGLHSFDESLHMAEVGCLSRQSAWGSGHMRAAITLLTIYARDVLGLSHLVADIHSDNRRAQRMFEKLGFRRVARESWSKALEKQA